MATAHNNYRRFACLAGIGAGASFSQSVLAASDTSLNMANTSWMLTSTVLVLFMTIPGLALFYAGLVRNKNVLSVLMQCFAITCLMSLIWFVYAYSLAFGDGGGAQQWIGGLDKLFFKGIGVDSLKGDIPETVFAMFQLTFAIITPALVAGGFAERIKFSAVLWFSVLWLTFVYAPVCHWVWGGGWLSDLGVMDFAGGTVVHINAGVAALVAALVLGKRHGFPDSPMAPHNLTMTVTGACMLWVGWFGFNAGSALAADGAAGMAMLVTHRMRRHERFEPSNRLGGDLLDPAAAAVARAAHAQARRTAIGPSGGHRHRQYRLPRAPASRHRYPGPALDRAARRRVGAGLTRRSNR